MNKQSLVFFAVAVVIGLMLTQDRKYFINKYIWLGAGIALLCVLPNLIWQYENNWATLELLENVQKTGKDIVLSPLEFIWQQIFILSPFSAPVWIAGVWYFIFNRTGKRFRALGIAYLVTLAIMIVLKGKNYYLAPVYPMLFAAGGVFWENFAEGFRFSRPIKIVYAVLVAITGIVFLPLAVPILPPEKFIAYQNAIGVAPPKTEVGHNGPLPQIFGDQFGWEEMAEKTAEVYNSLPPDERAKTEIYASNYGEAAAVDHFGPQYGLPKAISGHQSYYMWGFGDPDTRTLIVLGGEDEGLAKSCSTIEQKAPVGNPYGMTSEKFNIWICHGLKTPLPELWKHAKFWN